MDSNRILVTGAAGFVGARVCQLLLDRGVEVVGIDNLNNYYNPQLKEMRLRALAGNKKFTFERIDIENRAALDQLFTAGAVKSADGISGDKAPFNAIIHLAARAGVRPSTEDPWAYVKTNVEGTLNLLDMCRQREIPKFVFASTSSVYGANTKCPFHETDAADQPLSPYAASKKGAEALSYAYHHLYGTDISVLRYFTVYGPAGRPDMVVLRFIRRMADDEAIEVFGDGHQRRDFSYVDDIAAGTIAALKPVKYEVFNLGCDHPVELNEVIASIARHLRKTPKIKYAEVHRADVPETWASIEKARTLLGWNPQVTIEEGLRRTVEWFQRHRDELRSINLD
ncbi:MAG TPA: NAD-dependent epimerase/dehydratase family protein [Pirellulales bacterium]|jgi:nucleoside-diphosphate-sugar epimerase